jgi:hypothetical protein
MDECLILINGLYLFIEENKFFAHKKGIIAPDIYRGDAISMQRSYPLIQEMTGEHKLIKGSLLTPSLNEEFKKELIKSVDIKLVADGKIELIEHPEPAILKLITNDGEEFLPLIETFHKNGWETELWEFSINIPDSPISNAVTRVKTLDSIFEKICKCEQ